MPSIDVLDSTMHYEQSGNGAPIVFLHGNPTSSHAWRNVLPAMGAPGLLLAPDLIGMGRSGKPTIDYNFDDHSRYLDAWIDALGLDQVTLIGHDWGGALAFDWAARHPHRIRGIAFFETIVRPLEWSDFPPSGQARYERMRTPGFGEKLVLEENFFMEQALNATTLHGINEEDRLLYATAYPTAESRRPLLSWARSMPIAGEPAEIVTRIEAYDSWLASSDDCPKLLLTFTGSAEKLMIGPHIIDWCRRNLSSLEIENCGEAAHIANEDQPQAIGEAVGAWTRRHQLG